jgi:Arc/MetJ-type ribon-helix-helix transcriptional regulator
MPIFLHRDLEAFIHEQVRRGEYRTPEEVVNEALYLLYLRDQAEDDAGEAARPPRAA